MNEVLDTPAARSSYIAKARTSAGELKGKEATDRYLNVMKVQAKDIKKSGAAIAIAMKKAGKKPKGTEMKTFSEIKKQLEEGQYWSGAADKLADKIDNAVSSEHAKRIISKAPTKHLQYLHHWNMGLSGGGEIHEYIPHIKAELAKRKSLLSSAESSKHFDESIEEDAKGYKQVGGKMKNGKMVPNCVPTKESIDEDHVKVGDEVHAGFGQKGGAGFKGTVHKIEGEYVYVKLDSVGNKYGDRIVKAHHSTVTKEEV